MLSAVLILASSVRLAAATTAQGFEPASTGPLVQTANYTSFSNSTLKDRPTCKGKAFNRIIQVWLENTDFAVRSWSSRIVSPLTRLIKDCCLDGGLRDPRKAGDHSHQLQLRHPSLRAQLCVSTPCIIPQC